jgi:hypothetical protein
MTRPFPVLTTSQEEPAMGLFGPVFDSNQGAQASADYTDMAGGWQEPTPPSIGRDYDPNRDDDTSHGGQPHN